jgi:hypothetical protein
MKPRVQFLPRTMPDSAWAVYLKYVRVFHGRRGLTLCCRDIKLCLFSSYFAYSDSFVSSRIAYPSKSYFSR